MARDLSTASQDCEPEGSLDAFPQALREVNRRIHSTLSFGAKSDITVGPIAPLPQSALQGCTSISHIKSIPEVVKDLLEEGACLEKAGILPPERIAYYIINGNLYLWNFQTNKYHKVPQARPVEAVGLVKPKPDIFKSDLEYLLVIAGAGFVNLMGVSIGLNSTLVLHQINQEAAMEENSKITSVVGTELGRIFLGNASGDILEMLYQEKLNRIKGCQIINCSNTFFVRVKSLFNFLTTAASDQSIRSLVMDHQRGALYALSCDSSIKVISLGEDGLSFGMIHTWKPPSQQSIVDLQVIPRDDMSLIRLIAVTATGACLELRSSKPGDPLLAVGLECAHTRPPLFAAQSGICSAYSRGAVLISGFSHQQCFGIQFSESSSKVRSMRQYAVCQADVEPLAIMPCATGGKLGLVTQLDDVYSQYHLPPRRFDVLAKDGLWEIKKLRPVDQLLQILMSTDSPWVLFKPLVERHGLSEVCAMGLAILVKLPLALMLINNQVDLVSSSIVLNEVTTKRLIAMFNEVNTRSSDGDYAISPFVSGALALTAHILAPIWSTPLFRNKACNAKERELAVLPKLLSSAQIGVSSLLSALESPSLSTFSFEEKLLIQLRHFLASVSHCLGLLLILLELNLGAHLENLPSGFWSHAGSCTLAALNSKSKPTIIELAILVIKHEPSIWTPSKSIADRAGKLCKHFLTSSDISLFKGLELMMAAQNEPICNKRDSLFSETIDWFVLALPALFLSRLSELVLDYCSFRKPKVALQLIGKCVSIFNIPPKSSLETMEFSALCELLQAPLAVLKLQSPVLMDDAIACALSQIQEPNFHYGIYRWFMETGDLSSLYKAHVPFLEKYLRSMPSAKSTNSLYEYYTTNQKYTQAAVTLYDFATSNEVDFPLKDRLGYLHKALTTVTDVNGVDGSKARIEYRTKIENALKHVEFQFRALSEIHYNGCAEESAQYGMRLVPFPTLTKEILSKDLFKVCQLIALQNNPAVDNPSKVKDIWARIISSENNPGPASAKSLTYSERLRSRMIEISTMVPIDSEVFPLEGVCRQLLQLTLSSSDQISPDWISLVLLECGASPKRLATALESILITKVHPCDSPAFLKNTFMALSQVLFTLQKEFPFELSSEILRAKARLYIDIVPDLRHEIQILVQGLVSDI